MDQKRKQQEQALVKKNTAIDKLKRFAGNIHQFNNIFPQEKVWLQFDNNAYFQGDTIWFKGYATHASTLQRAPSKVLYIELVSPGGTILQTVKRPLVDGQCHGEIVLKDYSTGQARALRGILDYPSGFYEIRAYTYNMLNFDNNCIFSRVIPVYKTPAVKGHYSGATVLVDETVDNPIRRVANHHKEKEINLYFYPEGGNIALGVPNRIAFKALDINGIPLDGTLYYNSNDSTIVAPVEHNGMGAFIFTPTSANNRVTFEDADGNTKKFTLPKASDKACNLVVESPSDSLYTVHFSYPNGTKDTLGVTITCRGELFHFDTFIADKENTLSINSEGFPLGVCRLTIFNKNGEILASRGLFHFNWTFKAPQIAIQVPNKFIRPFEKVPIKLNLTDRFGNPFRDRICISVRDVEDYGNYYEDNMLTNMLLSSDLRGYIQQPQYYFEADDSAHRRHMDLLMLVQGWERYDWGVMTTNTKFVEMHRIEDSLTLNGWIKSKFARYKVKGIVVGAGVTAKYKEQSQSAFVNTNEDGYFGFNLRPFDDYAKANIQLFKKTNKLKDARICLEHVIKPDCRAYSGKELELNSPDANVILLLDSAVVMSNDSLSMEDLSEIVKENKQLKYQFDGIMLDQVDIEAKRYVDYDTFRALDAEKYTQESMDKGEYSTDLWGYLIDMGFNPVAQTYPVTFYIHDSKKVLKTGIFSDPFQIDMAYVKSIIIYDKPQTRKYWAQYTPLLIKYAVEHLDYSYLDQVNYLFNDKVKSYEDLENTNMYGNTDNEWIDLYSISQNKGISGIESFQKQYLIDVYIKDNWESMNHFETTKILGKRSTKIYGYSQMVDYYKTEYPVTPTDSLPQDFRRTLFWNPNVITDSLGNAQIEFYNNAYSRHFHISGSGITASGTPYCLDLDF
ncbi:MAG: hypothetical protein MJY74_03855 [Bacteroidaceae bacterium]|nr:hypothetical protein [Bacteroidaceae bacterium]